MHLSPIALFCYKRLDSLMECLDSLKQCPESINSDLIIFSDAPKTANDILSVLSVREYLNDIEGFNSVTIKLREKNLGVDLNIRYGLIEMSNKYDRFIVVEDDIVVSSKFLQYLNYGLCFYEKFTNIISISAFNYVNIPTNYKWDCYFAGRTNPWGWASWSSKIILVDWEIIDRNIFLSNKYIQSEFNIWGSDLSRMLIKTLNGKITTWDIRLDYHAFKYKMLTVYPTKNLVLNIGFNSDLASNTKGFNRYKVKLSDFINYSFNFPEFITDNPIIRYKFISKNSISNRLITYIFKLFNIKN